MDTAAQGHLSKATQNRTVAAMARQLVAQAISEMQAGVAFSELKEE